MEPKAKVDFDCGHMALPSHALFVGATMSGKTRLCLRLLSDPELFNPRPKTILFYYDQFQQQYMTTKTQLAEKGVELLLYKGCDGLTIESVGDRDGPTILLIDDFSEETSASSEIARIATNGRHKNISLWLVWHSLYSKHAASRIICQNIRWFFFLPSLRLESQLRTFGNQIGLQKRLLAAYSEIEEDVASEYRYLLVDAGPMVPDILRIRSHIHEAVQRCYI